MSGNPTNLSLVRKRRAIEGRIVTDYLALFCVDTSPDESTQYLTFPRGCSACLAEEFREVEKREARRWWEGGLRAEEEQQQRGFLKL